MEACPARKVFKLLPGILSSLPPVKRDEEKDKDMPGEENDAHYARQCFVLKVFYWHKTFK